MLRVLHRKPGIHWSAPQPDLGLWRNPSSMLKMCDWINCQNLRVRSKVKHFKDEDQTCLGQIKDEKDAFKRNLGSFSWCSRNRDLLPKQLQWKHFSTRNRLGEAQVYCADQSARNNAALQTAQPCFKSRMDEVCRPVEPPHGQLHGVPWLLTLLWCVQDLRHKLGSRALAVWDAHGQSRAAPSWRCNTRWRPRQCLRICQRLPPHSPSRSWPIRLQQQLRPDEPQLFIEAADLDPIQLWLYCSKKRGFWFLKP